MHRDVSGMKKQIEMLCRAVMNPDGGPTSPMAAHLLAQTNKGTYGQVLPGDGDGGRRTPVAAFDGVTHSPDPKATKMWVDDAPAPAAVAESGDSTDAALRELSQMPRQPLEPKPQVAPPRKGSVMSPVEISFTPEPASLV